MNPIQEAVSRGLSQAKDAKVTDISIDIETLGKRPGAPIVAIGLAAFSRATGEVYPVMYHTIDLQSSIDYSTGVDPSTLEWWLQQAPEAVAQTFNDKSNRWNLIESIAQLNDVFQYLGNPKPWGNGATFDIGLLEAVIDLTGMNIPWHHRDVRDVRTVVDLGRDLLGFNPKFEMPFEGTKHNALADAEHQAKYTVAIIRRLAPSQTITGLLKQERQDREDAQAPTAN